MTIEFHGKKFTGQPTILEYVHWQFDQVPLRRPLSGSALDIAQELYTRIDYAGVVPAVFRLVPHLGTRELQYFAGGWIQISIEGCVRREGNTAPDLATALRNTVRDQTYEFKAGAFAAGTPRCAISGVELRSATTDVDHVLAFSELKAKWLEVIGGDREVEFVRVVTGGWGLRGDLAASWASFHGEHAILRLLDRGVHRAIGREKRAAATARAA